jgi:hypothetical protein
MQVLSEGKTLDIFNNIAFKTRKYGAFEVQVTDEYFNNPRFKSADVNIYNNTAGQLNSQFDWDAQMLDFYRFGGLLNYYNNLGFEMKKTVDQKVGIKGITDMINYQFPAKFGRCENNTYVATWQEAVTDLITFKSKVNGVGAQ